MFTAIIVDDEDNSREAMAALLRDNFPEVQILALCRSADEAKRAITASPPNLLFLDVEMPGKSGLDLLKELDQIDFDIIFTTAHVHYALQAIKASALDFLLKPVNRTDLAAALEKYKNKKIAGIIGRQVEVLLQHYEGNSGNVKTIILPTLNEMEFVRTNQIIRVKADNVYSTFYLTDKREITVSRALKEYEDLLSGCGFFRVHQSHIINLEYIKKYSRGDGGSITMTDGSVVDVSRNKKDDFLEVLKKL